MKRTSYRKLWSWLVAVLVSIVPHAGLANDSQGEPYAEPSASDESDQALPQLVPTEEEGLNLSTPEGVNMWNQGPLWVDNACVDEAYYSRPDMLAGAGNADLCEINVLAGTPYRWMVRADAMFLDRSTADGEQSIAFGDPLNPKGTEILHTGDLDFSSSWGPRISLSRCITDRASIEVGYYNIPDWDSVATRSGAISIQFPSFAHPPLPPGPFGTATFNYSSQLHSFETNIRRVSCNEWLTWIGGFRYLELSEQYGATFVTGGGVSRYTINTDNRLYGFQFGGEAHLWDCARWSVDMWGKASLMGNAGSQRTFEDVSAIGGGTATASARGNSAAFLGELAVVVNRQISCRLWARAGYQVLWLDRLALAPEQLDNTNPSIPLATADLSGDLFLHGGFFGLEGLF